MENDNKEKAIILPTMEQMYSESISHLKEYLNNKRISK